jgi:two-component system, NarL family, invasion response regulator UvrY
LSRDKLKVLIADDHALVRSGLKRLLSDERDIESVTEVENSGQALKRVREEDWDVVIMDINMPGQNVFDVLHLIKTEKPELPVLILTMHPEGSYAVRALKEGASGYITKNSAPDHLISAIRKVVEGGAYLSPALALQLASRLRTKPKETLHELLSNRELSVLCSIAEGKHLSEIADELNLSAKTITTYRTRVLSKLGMHTNTELTRYALEHGLIT